MSKEIVNTTKDGIRPPIVTIMGHVDHGKTSILDFIRKTNVQAKEYGGITQHIGAYQISYNSKLITFIDTPGHAAFTQMRARGGKAADIVVLVVAADEGVKPQTREAISHIKAAGSPLIVAINKIDKPGSNPQKVKQELAQENILVEDWGGDIMTVELSAKTGQNIDKLLEAILVLSELLEIKGSPNNELEAIIIESKLDRKRGVVVSAVVREGILKSGDLITASGHKAKVKALIDERNQALSEALPSKPVEILGFKDTPCVGDLILGSDSELAELSMQEDQIEIVGHNAKRTISLVLKADTQGTLEAVKGSLANLVTESVESTYAIKFLYCGTGDITESDVMLAQSAKGIVMGFDVRLNSNVEDYAEDNKIVVKVYKTIYDLIDDAKKLLEGTAIEEEKKIKGRAYISKLFKLPSGDIIAGCKVVAGALKPNLRISIYDKNPSEVTDEDIPLYRGAIKKLKQGKNDVSVVGKDIECGVLLKPEFEGLSKDLWIEVK